jgi:chromate transport protein ChrA
VKHPLVLARVVGLTVAVILFVVAALSDSSWQKLSGFGLAIVALAMLVDTFYRHTDHYTHALLRAFGLGLSTLFFFLAAVVSASNALHLFAMAFVGLALAAIADHIPDFEQALKGLRSARPQPAAPPTPVANVCAHCGHPLEGAERFCTACGTPRP